MRKLRILVHKLSAFQSMCLHGTLFHTENVTGGVNVVTDDTELGEPALASVSSYFRQF